MSTSMSKILFVSHDAHRTGAPMVLLNFIRWYKVNSDHSFDIFLKEGGALEKKFEDLGATYYKKGYCAKTSLLVRIFRKLVNKKYKYELPEKFKRNKYDLIFLNTSVSLEIIGLLKSTFNCPVICNIHENEYAINSFYLDLFDQKNTSLVDHFIAVSKSTKYNLIYNLGLDPNKISLIYETINIKEINQISCSSNQIKNELNISSEFIVGSAGVTSWRKGYDLFIQLAAYIKKYANDCNIKFIWVGEIKQDCMNELKHDLKYMGIEEKVIFTGAKENPQNYFQIFDVFCLLSREDPFPLVAMESAALSKPIICFEKAGGIPELLEGTDGGYCVPYGDIEEMAKRIILLYNDRALLNKMGTTINNLILNYDVDIIGKQISNLIDQYSK